jgi:hypothetical protein
MNVKSTAVNLVTICLNFMGPASFPRGRCLHDAAFWNRGVLIVVMRVADRRLIRAAFWWLGADARQHRFMPL